MTKKWTSTKSGVQPKKLASKQKRQETKQDVDQMKIESIDPFFDADHTYTKNGVGG